MSSAVLETDVAVEPPKPPNRIVAWWRGFGRPPRIMGIDIARALAVIGMIGAHVGTTPDLVWTDPATWAGVVHGRSSVLFAIVAGISVAIVTGRTALLPPEQIPAARLRLVGRGAAVFVIGLVLELLNTSIAVILAIYGLLFIVATAFLHWSAKKLFVVGGILALFGPPLMALLHALSAEAWGSALGTVVYGTYPITVWIAYLLIGMGVGRLRIDTAKVAAGVLGAGIVLAVTGYGIAALVDEGDGDDWGSSGSDSWEEPGYVTKRGSEMDWEGYVCEIYDEDWISCYPEDQFWGDLSELDSAPGTVTEEDLATIHTGNSIIWLDEGSEEWAGSDSSFDDSWFDSWVDDEHDYFGQLDWSEIWDRVRLSVTSDDPHSGAVLDIVGSAGFALAVVGASILISWPLRWLLLPVAALGSMPLTAYSVHVISVMVMAGGPGGFVWSEGNERWLWSCVAIGAAATLWAMVFGKGPLERLVGRAGNAMARAPRRMPES